MADFPQQFPAASTAPGNLTLGVRKDSPGDLAGTNAYTASIQFDSAGSLRVNEQGGKATYFATSQFACDSTATDIWTLTGSATKTGFLQFLAISSSATAAATGDLSVIRRSAADTAGTAVNPTVAKADPSDGAATLTPAHYTAHPTALGTSAGVIFGQRYTQPAPATTVQPGIFLDFRQYNGGKGLRISGATDIIAVNVPAGLGGAGNAWDVTACWTEEPTTA